MNIEATLIQSIQEAFQALFQIQVQDISLQPTRKDFEGSHTLVTFPYAKTTKKKPEETAQLIGQYLKEKTAIVRDFNVVKGFLNIILEDQVWINAFDQARQAQDFGQSAPNGQKVMVEFSSPNTNKPLHLGHLRNNFLGDAIARIFKANGYEVFKTNLVNDRGIHICKSMVAYQRKGEDETPDSAQIKGDHLVGKYYVAFDKELKQETSVLEHILQAQKQEAQAPYKIIFNADVQKKIDAILKNIATTEDGKKKKELRGDLKQIIQNQTYLMREAQDLLQKWEAGETETLALWKKMNGWVYEGFHQTYQKIGIEFDKIYYESQTYLLGKNIIEEGLKQGIFYQEADGSVWIDLSDEKLDKKLLLRSDGTSVYMTQDLGTADLKYEDFKIDKSVYVVGNEQDYHFKVLFKILEKLGRPYAEGLYHLSYGMVDLPTGKMKSREGTVVDADDLIAQMLEIARQKTNELGKTEGFKLEELEKLYHTIAVGALKYFLLKVDPKKRMLFNPEESVDFEGDAGPFIQFNYARCSAILRTAQEKNIAWEVSDYQTYQHLHPAENALIQMILSFPKKIEEAGENYAPSLIAQYAYDLAKTYSKFYTECSIFQADTKEAQSFRVALTEQNARTLKKAMGLLGIEVPERM